MDTQRHSGRQPTRRGHLRHDPTFTLGSVTDQQALVLLVSEFYHNPQISPHNKHKAHTYLKSYNQHENPEDAARALQALVGADQTGSIDDQTIKHLQATIGMKSADQDGVVGPDTTKHTNLFFARTYREDPSKLHRVQAVAKRGLEAVTALSEPAPGVDDASTLSANPAASMIYNLNKNAGLNWDFSDKSSDKLKPNAPAKPVTASTGYCAGYLTLGLASAGISIGGHANDMGNKLESNDPNENMGYHKITDTAHYQPVAGDIAYLPPQVSHPKGHITAYDGRKWVSDFTQGKDQLAATWPDGPPHQIIYFRNDKLADMARQIPEAKIDSLITKANADASQTAQQLLAKSEASQMASVTAGLRAKASQGRKRNHRSGMMANSDHGSQNVHHNRTAGIKPLAPHV